MGSYKWGYKAPYMAYNCRYPTYDNLTSSWVVLSRVISALVWLIIIVTLLIITPPKTTLT